MQGKTGETKMKNDKTKQNFLLLDILVLHKFVNQNEKRKLNEPNIYIFFLAVNDNWFLPRYSLNGFTLCFTVLIVQQKNETFGY